MKSKTQKKPLFIYDWYGTVEAPWWIVFLMEQYHERYIAKAEGRTYYPSKTLREFKKQHNNRQTVLVPGMEEAIRFTASIGNNILLSNGNHLNDASPELLALADYFQSWMFAGKQIGFGDKPATKNKNDPEVAEALLKQFDPDKVFVIGDSNTEAKFAEFLHADTFIFCGLDKKQIKDGQTVPHVEQHVTGHPIIRYIKERLGENQYHVSKSEQSHGKQMLVKKLNINDGK